MSRLQVQPIDSPSQAQDFIRYGAYLEVDVAPFELLHEMGVPRERKLVADGTRLAGVSYPISDLFHSEAGKKYRGLVCQAAL